MFICGWLSWVGSRGGEGLACIVLYIVTYVLELLQELVDVGEGGEDGAVVHEDEDDARLVGQRPLQHVPLQVRLAFLVGWEMGW